MSYLFPASTFLPLREALTSHNHVPKFGSNTFPIQRHQDSLVPFPSSSSPARRVSLEAPFCSLVARAEANQATLTSSAPPTSPPSPSSAADSPAELVRRFYDGINGRNLESVEELIAENCVYEDLIFPRPFVGRKAILEFFKKFTESISADLQFVIDDISGDDSSAVGVTWHLEWKGRSFPFSKGCSFYRCEVSNGKRKIIYGRDSVEPALKPGELALSAIRGVTLLLQQFPQLADRL
ncbi:hypothetical protein EJ110_NYTH16897 [Nymphaea thermarum]|nr:hypothetical protein EJ110_NYTH16897 [Nymphaea thermarum]